MRKKILGLEAVLPEHHANYVILNDSLGRRTIDPPNHSSRHERLTITISSPNEICCQLLEARLVPSKFLKIVLGGTAASHTCSGVGGGHFLIKKR